MDENVTNNALSVGDGVDYLTVLRGRGCAAMSQRTPRRRARVRNNAERRMTPQQVKRAHALHCQLLHRFMQQVTPRELRMPHDLAASVGSRDMWSWFTALPVSQRVMVRCSCA